MQLAAQFSAIAGNKSIDRSARVIRGVSVITAGKASGHGLFIDDTTLKQVVETASAYPGGLKVKINHGSDLQSIVASLKNFSVDGDKVRADLHVLDNAEDAEKIFELAEKMPESFGLSISFSNHPEKVDGKLFARCAEIYSADLVDSPAANPSGLFSKPNTNKPMSEENASAPSVAELAAEIAEIKKAVAEHKPTDLSAVTADIEAAKTELAKLTKAAADAADAAKKTEISALVAEASRDGKVVPLTDVQLSKMDIADIREMITKLPAAQVQLSRKTNPVPTTKDGKEITLDSAERLEFCRQKKTEGADALTALIRGQSNHN